MAQDHLSLKNATLNLDQRFDDLSDRAVDRYQGRIRVGFALDLLGLVDLVGLAATGPTFNNDWSTLAQSGTPHDSLALAFRQVYLKKTFRGQTLKLGAFEPLPTVGAGGLAPTGWMDGAQAQFHASWGDVRITAGSLGNPKLPNVLDRKFQSNFLEVELSRTLFDELATETAVQVWEDGVFVQERASLFLRVLGEKILKISGETLVRINQEMAANAEVGLEWDALKSLLHKFDKRLELRVYESYLDNRLKSRSDLVSAFYIPGLRTTIHLQGKIDAGANMVWIARTSFGNELRTDLGINIRLTQQH